MKLKLIALAALLAASAPSFAAIDGSTTGNGSLIVNFISQGGPSATAGNDDISAVFDLGVSMNTVLGWNGLAGFTRTWNLTSGLLSGTGIVGSQAVGSYGSSWADLNTFATPARQAAIEFNVIALDNTDFATAAGGSRYLTTATNTAYPSLTNSNLNGFQDMDRYVTANNLRGTHATQDNGASTATPSDPSNSYFRAIGGFVQGDTWLTKTTADTTKNLATAQNFWFLATTAPGGFGQATKQAFGVDLNGSGALGTGEFAQWTVNQGAGTITFTSPVPEAETWAMLVAGLGLLGAIVRRRRAG